MKIATPILLITIVVFLFNLGCSDEMDSLKKDDKIDTVVVFDTIAFVDTVVVYDTLLIDSLCDSSVCMYDSVSLDFIEFEAVAQQELIGEWQLEAFVNIFGCRVQTEPLEPESPLAPGTHVKVIFHDNDSVSGETEWNSFRGKYGINHNKINFIDIYRTEVNDTEWGDKFFELMRNTDYFTIHNDKLFVNSTEVLIFRKK